MHTFYIRQPNEEEGRGPYNKEQLETLVIAGQINEESLYYVEEDQSWHLLREHPELSSRLFPKKMNMRVKTRREIADPEGKENLQDDFSRILKEDKVSEKRANNQEISSILLGTLPYWCQIAAGISLLAGASLLRPHFSSLGEIFSNFSMLWKQPAIGVGFLDVLVAILLLLGASSLSNFLRARFLGIAGIALLFWWTGHEFNHLAATVIASVGILMFTCFRWAVVQGIGAALTVVALVVIILGGGYTF